MERNIFRSQIYALLLQATEERVRFSACGIFNVGMHLIPKVCAPNIFLEEPCRVALRTFSWLFFAADRFCGNLFGNLASRG